MTSQALRRTVSAVTVATVTVKTVVLIGAFLAAAGCATYRGWDSDEFALPRDHESDGFTVMTFNIRFIDRRGPESWRERRALVAEAIELVDADIIAFQEVEDRAMGPSGVSEQLTWLQERFPAYDSASDGSVPGTPTIQPIFFRRNRFELVDLGFRSLSRTPDAAFGPSWGTTQYRFVSWVRLRDLSTGSTLLIVNVHLDHLSGAARRRSTRFLAEEAGRLAGPADSVILVGDFNTFERAPAMRPLLAAGFRHALPPSRTGSFHAFTGRTLWPRIDHILIDSTLESLGGRLIYHSRDGVYPSDHFPAAATLVRIGR